MQEINETGVLKVQTDKNVVFTKRKLRDLVFVEGEFVSCNYTKQSDLGDLTVSVQIPFDHFSSKIENLFWELIDQQEKKETTRETEV